MVPNSVVIVGVAGGSGSGKRSFSKRLANELGEGCSIICLDNFYRDFPSSSYSECNFDHPNSLDFDELVEVVKKIRLGQTVFLPVYDLERCVRLDRKTEFTPKQFVILEGVLALWEPRLRSLEDLKVFVKVDDDERLARKLIRDTLERGLEMTDVLCQYNRFAKPSYNDFILPSMRFADLIVPHGGENEVALQLVSTMLPGIHTQSTVA